MLLGGTQGLQGLPHEIQMRAEYQKQKNRQNGLWRTILEGLRGLSGSFFESVFVYDEQYLRAYARQHSERGKRMKNLRQSTVEPVFGSLTQFHGLRKIGVLGKAGAHKVMLMAAIAFNLKKYLKKGGKKPSFGLFKTIMDAFQGCLNIIYQEIRLRQVLLKAL